MNSARAAFLLCCGIGAVNAAEIELEVYAPDTSVHELRVEAQVQLPAGWSTSEHNGSTYIIGGGKVYGSLSLTYSKHAIANYTSQFGMPDPPKREVEGEVVRFLVAKTGASYARKVEYVWMLRGSVRPYPDFARRRPQ